MIPFLIGALSFSVPTSWNEITVDQFLKLQQATEQQASIDIFIDPEIWNKLKDFDKERIVECLLFLSDAPDFEALPLPSSYILQRQIDDAYQAVEIKIPSDLTTETYGQKVYFEHLALQCIEETGDVIAMMDKAIAIYCYEQFMGKPFDDEDMDGIIAAIRKTKVVDSYPVAAFFLRSYLKSLPKRERHL